MTGPTVCYLVVKFSGNYDILGCQKLDTIWFCRTDAEKRAKNMQRRHNWIWRVIPVAVPLDATKEAIKAELEARGISTT